MSEQPKLVPGFILVTWSCGRKVYLNANRVSAVWEAADGGPSYISTGDDETEWAVQESVSEIAELLRQAMGAHGHG